MENLTTLLESLARGARLDECWKESGFSSREEAARALARLASALERDSAGSASTRLERPRRPRDGSPRGVDHLVVYVDGASRGNPGPAAAAAVAFLPSGEELTSVAKRLGHATNNAAEYSAVIEGLRLAASLGARTVTVRLDSELVARQLSGEYRTKSAELRSLAEEVAREIARFERCRFEQVPREENRDADRVANKALNSVVDP